MVTPEVAGLASSRGVVVKSDDGARTQNGHIRNDTRGASRRIVKVSVRLDVQEKLCRG
jgi:hypothetical protein